MRRQCAGWVVGMLVSVVMCASVQAVTPRTGTTLVTFPSGAMTNYTVGFDYSSAGGADMVIDKDGNPHIVTSTGEVGHLGHLQYRRWTHATNGWSGPVLTFEDGNGLEDDYRALTTVDDANRVHLLYFHRVATNTTSASDPNTPYDLYHVWCTNASGTTPLTTNNWVKTKITTIGTNTLAAGLVSGSLISVGSNLLLYARGGVDADGNGLLDIRIDRADWDGSAWVWSTVGSNGLAIANTENNTYGGLNTPRLTYDRLNNLLHMSYRRDIYPREQAYAVSSQPTNPIASTWTAQVRQGEISPANYEGNGGTGILEDGRAVAAVYLGANRDGMGASVTNFTRVRATGFAGTWGPWKVAFSNDFRSLGASGNSGYATPSAFAPDGAGGLFMVTGNQYVDHWDPKTETWADVFTNLPVGADSYAIANMGVIPQEYPKPCTIYHYRRDAMKLYVGQYFLMPNKPSILIMLK